MVKAIPLLKAYATDDILNYGGYIVSSFFEYDSISIYEITTHGNVKNILKTRGGFIFKTSGNVVHN